MQPQTYPSNTSQQMTVKEVITTGLTEWVDYIPVQAVTEVSGKALIADDNGHIPVVFT